MNPKLKHPTYTLDPINPKAETLKLKPEINMRGIKLELLIGRRSGDVLT